jgi:NAD dependent epimerase/dehydratase family enzyme
VSLHDVVRAIDFLLTTPSTSGPYNISAPVHTSNREFTRMLGSALRRPTIVPVPKFGLQILYGEFAEDILASFDIDPSRLMEAGFAFDHPDPASVLDSALHG